MKPDKELKGRSGIYLIVNVRTGKVYVGKTSCFYRRCSQYIYEIREQRHAHINNYLLAAINKLGVGNFKFVVAEFCDVADISQRELAWMRQLRSTDRDHGYNLRMDSRTGMVAHPETVEKIRGNITRQWADGVRDGHSDKLRDYWADADDRKVNQAEVMRKALTKYHYKVHLPTGCVDVAYKELAELGYAKAAMSAFYKKRHDTVVCKGVTIERVRHVK